MAFAQSFAKHFVGGVRPAGPDLAPPGALWLVSEPVRALAEVSAGLVTHGLVQRLAPRGDGHTVLVLPGLGASDLSTGLLRRFLGHVGYDAVGWDQGRNTGAPAGLQATMRDRLRELHRRSGRTVSLVGHSLGGVYARELAKLEPECVRQVISLGSPFAGHLRATHATRLYEWLSGERVDDIEPEQRARMRIKPPVPTTSVFSKADGVVSWRCSVETARPEGESIQLRGASHLGMAACPLALWVVADRLAQPQGQWRPFVPTGWQRAAYVSYPPRCSAAASGGSQPPAA